jgi:hypothetical protein
MVMAKVTKPKIETRVENGIVVKEEVVAEAETESKKREV